MAIKILQLIKNNNISFLSVDILYYFNNKRIMFDQKSQINQDIDLHQKRKLFEDPKDSTNHSITNLFIYSSQYYPATKPLITKILNQLTQSHQSSIYESILHLYKCLQREILAGPSSSYIPPSQIPHIERLDNTFLSIQDHKQDALNHFAKAFETLNLLEIIPKSRVKEIFWYSSSKLLIMKRVQDNNANHKSYLQQLEIDGQSWLQSTPFTALFVTISFILQTIVTKHKLQPELLLKFKLLRARLGLLHNKCLKHPVGKLADIVLTNYKEVLAQSQSETTLDDYAQLLLEYAYALLFYYKYSQSEQIVRHCAILLKMKIQFTGKLGRRTKYQVFDTPQLVMNLVETTIQEQNSREQSERIHDEQQGQKLQIIDPKLLVSKQRGVENTKQKGINISSFDEESILLQSPKFVEQEQKQHYKLQQINQSHLLAALAILYLEWKSTSRDQMLFQSIATAITTLLRYDIKTSFSYNFSLLLLRSLNEFSRIKNTERALDQLQKLKASFNGKADKDISNIYSTPYQTCLGFVLIMAEKYMEIGLSISAVQLFQRAGLYEQCIDGLIGKNYKQKALELANQLIEDKGKNPRLLCMLGDIHNSKQPRFYEQAWEISKGTCARAQRSLGWLYYNQNNFEKAVESFSKATQASYYHPNTWFTLGCCYMRLNQFDKALKAFSEAISIDDTQGEAWGNMASCYMYLKKTKEAYATLTQAVKYSERNWKLWANLLSVSISLKQFYKYFECLEKLVKLGQHEIITQDILAKVVQIMLYNNQNHERKRTLFNYKNRIDRFFSLLQEIIGQVPLVWRIKTKYLIELLQYYDILYVHYHNLNIQNKIDPNDFVPQYETLQQTQLTTKTRTAQTKQLIVASKQNELNMTMKVGWHQDKTQSTKVKGVLEEYAQIYKKYSQKADLQEFKLFSKGVSQKIAVCLDINYQLKLQL